MSILIPMDQIFIHDLAVRGILGVYEHERHTPQAILINVTLFADLSAVALSDNLADAVDYHRLALKLKAHAETAARLTVEALAEDLARLCLAEPGVQRARVRVEKPEAIEFTRSVGVEIERRRESY